MSTLVFMFHKTSVSFCPAIVYAFENQSLTVKDLVYESK